MLNAIYVRVSTDKQETFLQEEEISIFLKFKDITEHHIYRDEGYSGKNTDRPGLKQLLFDVKQGKVKTLIVWKLDRLARSLPDLLTTLKTLKDNNTTFISIKENMDLTTPQGILTMQVLGAVAEFERSMIHERIKSGVAKARARGVKFGRPSKITGATKAQMRSLRTAGLSNAAIAAKLEINVGSVYHFFDSVKKLDGGKGTEKV